MVLSISDCLWRTKHQDTVFDLARSILYFHRVAADTTQKVQESGILQSQYGKFSWDHSSFHESKIWGFHILKILAYKNTYHDNGNNLYVIGAYL